MVDDYGVSISAWRRVARHLSVLALLVPLVTALVDDARAQAPGTAPVSRLTNEMFDALDARTRAEASVRTAEAALANARQVRSQLATSDNHQAKAVAQQAVTEAEAAVETARQAFAARDAAVAAVCARARDQYARDRTAVERQFQNSRSFVEDLAEWEAANDKAMKDALVSAANIFLGRYAQALLERAQRRDRWRKILVSSRKVLKHKGVDVNLVMLQFDRHAVSYEKAMSLIKQAKVVKTGLGLKQGYDVLKGTLRAVRQAIESSDDELTDLLRTPAIWDALNDRAPGEDARIAALQIGLEKVVGALPPLYNPLSLAEFGYNALAFNESRKRLLERYEMSELEARAGTALKTQLENTMAVLKRCL